MKFRVYVEVDVSRTIAETIQRNGFQVCPDGSAMQIKVPHAPTIPQRKTKVVFVENPTDTLDDAIHHCAALELLRRLVQWNMLDTAADGQYWKDEIKKVTGSA